MEIQGLSSKYIVRKLGVPDTERVLNLYEGNPQYFSAMDSVPSEGSVQDDMTVLPPGKAAEDKHFVGFFDSDALIAVMDLIEGYPKMDIAFIGLFMMEKSVQGQGIGSEIVNDVFKALKNGGFSAVRLGFVETNKQSQAFWIKNGFTPTGIKSEHGTYTVVYAQRELIG